MTAEYSDSHGIHSGKFVEKQGKYSVIECQICGFRHIAPLPTEDEVEEFYKQQYYQSEKVDYFDDNENDFEWYKIDFGVRIDFVAGLLGKPGKVLDIGCGPGVFLRVAKEKGWDVSGIEPSPVAANHARKFDLNVTNEFFGADNNYEKDGFDFVHLSEVLEHVPNPGSVIRNAADLVKPGGYLTISVPNDFNVLQEAAFYSDSVDRKWWIFPEHHLNYFNFDSLEKLLEKFGLVPLERTTNFPMELFLLMGENYTKDALLGKQCHMRRKSLDLSLYNFDAKTYTNFYRKLASVGLGRVAVVTAQKRKN